MCQILERLKDYIDYKGIAISAFEKSVGMSNASFGKQLKNKGAIGTDKLENILKVYNDISPLWLMTGKGSMLITPKTGIDSNIIKTDPLKGENYIPPTAPIDNGCSNIKIYDPALQETDKMETRPRIPFDAAAGALSVAMPGVSSLQCEQFPLIPTLPDYDFTIIARGDSMTPDILSGDELACVFVQESKFIQWGRPHVLDTAQGIVLKRIFNQKDAILCRSANHDYPDFEIPKDEIYHLAIVVGLIRHF